MQHLISKGRRRIAFLGDASSHYPEFRDRYRGGCEAQKSNGIAIVPGRQVDAITNEQSGYDAALELIRRKVKFDAIFAASDLIAIGAIRALEEKGLEVPGDIAVVGFDDIPAAGLAHPPLTTVQQDYRRAGEVLVDALLKQIRKQKADTTALPARLIVRKSSGT